MHVLVATDGHVDPDLAATMATALAGPEGSVTVITVVEVPRRFLNELRAAHSQTSALSFDREDVSVVSSDVREKDNWPGDDAMIARYLDNQRELRTAGVAAALRDRGVEPSVVVREGENVAQELIAAIGELGVDAVAVGSRGGGFFDGLLGSTGTKLARQAPCPVLLLRNG